MAIHDLHYSTPAPDFAALVHRLQLLSEMRLGRRIRAEEDAENAAFALANSRAD